MRDWAKKGSFPLKVLHLNPGTVRVSVARSISNCGAETPFPIPWFLTAAMHLAPVEELCVQARYANLVFVRCPDKLSASQSWPVRWERKSAGVFCELFPNRDKGRESLPPLLPEWGLDVWWGRSHFACGKDWPRELRDSHPAPCHGTARGPLGPNSVTVLWLLTRYGTFSPVRGAEF